MEAEIATASIIRGCAVMCLHSAMSTNPTRSTERLVVPSICRTQFHINHRKSSERTKQMQRLRDGVVVFGGGGR
jgi:hypothetical protein